MLFFTLFLSASRLNAKSLRFLLFWTPVTIISTFGFGSLALTDGSPAVRLGDGSASALSPDTKWVVGGLPRPPVQLYLIPTRAGEQRTRGGGFKLP
jgi:hypothetical protein